MKGTKIQQPWTEMEIKRKRRNHRECSGHEYCREGREGGRER